MAESPTFVRVGSIGMPVGPFAGRDGAVAWLLERGFELEHEGATWKLYECVSPAQYDANREALRG